MPSLAGKPPYATDERDSAYDTARPRLQQRKPVTQTSSRETTYGAYDDYFNESDDGPDRRSGIDAVGQGFMNAFMADDSDSEDEEPVRQRKQSPLVPPASKQPPASLRPAEKQAPPAYTPSSGDTKSAPIDTKPPPPAVLRPARIAIAPPLQRPDDTGTPPPAGPDVRSPPPLAAPRPSRPTDLSAIQAPSDIRAPQPRMPIAHPHPPPAHIAIPSPALSSPTEKFGIPTTPLELNAPMTPITPVFARRPSKPSSPRPMSVKFQTKGGIMRGKDEDTPLTRSTAKNDFWNRFSMVMKDDSSIGGKKESTWLAKTQSRGKSMSRVIWIVGIVLLLAIGGGIGFGWYFTHNHPTTSAPVAIGGSENGGVVHSTTSTATPSASGSVKPAKVSATFTLSDRSLPEPTPFLAITPEPLAGPFDSLPPHPNGLTSHRRRRRALQRRLA